MSITAISDLSIFSPKSLESEAITQVYVFAEKRAPLVREINWTDLHHRIALIEKAGIGIRHMLEDAWFHL